MHCFAETSPVAFLAGKALGYSADRLCSVASGGASRLYFQAKGNTILASVPELGGNYLACLSSEAGVTYTPYSLAQWFSTFLTL